MTVEAMLGRKLAQEYEALFAAEYPERIDGIPTARGVPGPMERARMAALGAFIDATNAARRSWRARVVGSGAWVELGDQERAAKAEYRVLRSAWAAAAGIDLGDPEVVHRRTTPVKKPKIRWQLTFAENVAAQRGLFG
jgi:hypothetical protein